MLDNDNENDNENVDNDNDDDDDVDDAEDINDAAYSILCNNHE